MQASSGAGMMGSFQQPVRATRPSFPLKGLGISGSLNQIMFNSVKPCRSSHLEGSLVTGRPPSSVSVPVPEISG